HVGSLDVIREEKRKGATFSPRDRTQFVNSKLRRRLYQHCPFGQMLCKLGIRFQPPKRIRGKNKMRRAAAPQPLKIGNRLLAVTRSASVNRVSLGEVPTLSPRIAKYRRIAHVRGNNQCIRRCDYV